MDLNFLDVLTGDECRHSTASVPSGVQRQTKKAKCSEHCRKPTQEEIVRLESDQTYGEVNWWDLYSYFRYTII